MGGRPTDSVVAAKRHWLACFGTAGPLRFVEPNRLSNYSWSPSIHIVTPTPPPYCSDRGIGYTLLRAILAFGEARARAHPPGGL
jgi:hypothetical protein